MSGPFILFVEHDIGVTYSSTDITPMICDVESLGIGIIHFALK